MARTSFAQAGDAGATCAVIVTAAGTSSRLGTGVKKEYALIGGRTVLSRAVRAFTKTGWFAAVVVTHPADLRAETEAALGTDALAAELFLEPGGTTRQESVRRGLARLSALAPDLVLVHDGSRPWVDASTIERVLKGAGRTGACIPVVPQIDAVKTLRADGTVREHMPRGLTVCAQTPQGFDYGRISAAHRRAESDTRTYADDAEVFEAYEGPVLTVPGEPRNRKITYIHDLPDNVTDP